jgi:uncharacterized membrane protein
MSTRVIIWILIIAGILLIGFLFYKGSLSQSTVSKQEKQITFEKTSIDVPNRVTMGNFVIRTEQEWMDAIGTNVKSIDFTQKTALVISMGQRMTGGYSIDVKSISEKNNKINVALDFISPGKNCINIQVVNYPTQVILIPATKTEVVWEINNKTQDCPQ